VSQLVGESNSLGRLTPLILEEPDRNLASVDNVKRVNHVVESEPNCPIGEFGFG
jgi:hypothetical protein